MMIDFTQQFWLRLICIIDLLARMLVRMLAMMLIGAWARKQVAAPGLHPFHEEVGSEFDIRDSDTSLRGRTSASAEVSLGQKTPSDNIGAGGFMSELLK